MLSLSRSERFFHEPSLQPKILRSGTVLLAFILTTIAGVKAERLPIKAYTIADGLPHDYVRCVVQDGRGFIWLCTSAGLARFDGQAFKVFTTAHGLPSRFINDVLIARDGRYGLPLATISVYLIPLQWPTRLTPHHLQQTRRAPDLPFFVRLE